MGLLDWFQETWNEAKEFMYSVLLTGLDLLKDLAIWIFEQFLDISILALNGLDTYFDTLDVTAYISAIPPETQWFLGQIGLPAAMSMIITAITIRLLLQLIPFTRLGS